MATPVFVKGRELAELVHRLVEFWEAHRATLILVLPTDAIAALDALALVIGAIQNINPPGPG